MTIEEICIGLLGAILISFPMCTFIGCAMDKFKGERNITVNKGFIKMSRIDYQNKILDIIDRALNDLNTDDFDILIRRVQEYIDDLN